MSYSLNSIKGILFRIIKGTISGVLEVAHVA